MEQTHGEIPHAVDPHFLLLTDVHAALRCNYRLQGSQLFMVVWHKGRLAAITLTVQRSIVYRGQEVVPK